MVKPATNWKARVNTENEPENLDEGNSKVKRFHTRHDGMRAHKLCTHLVQEEKEQSMNLESQCLLISTRGECFHLHCAHSTTQASDESSNAGAVESTTTWERQPRHCNPCKTAKNLLKSSLTNVGSLSKLQQEQLLIGQALECLAPDSKSASGHSQFFQSSQSSSIKKKSLSVEVDVRFFQLQVCSEE